MSSAAKAHPVLRALLLISEGQQFNVGDLSDSTGLPVRNLSFTLGGLSELRIVEFARPGRQSSLAKDRWYKLLPGGHRKAQEILGAEPESSETTAATAPR